MKRIFGFGRKKKSGPPSSTSETGSVLSTGYELKEKDLSKFHRAAFSGDVVKIRQLLHKQDINQVDKENRTPLHLACANGHLDVVKLLVENKAKLNVCDNANRSPLMKAIQCQHEPCATILLEHQADPNVVDVNENAALHLAALIPSMPVAVQLLEHGANINAINKDGCTPLILSVTENHEEMVELLIKEGADINSRDNNGRTSLMIAASNGHISLVKYLLQHNADTSVKDLTGWTADDYAVNDGHHPCSQLIFEHVSRNKRNNSPPYYGAGKKKGTSAFGSSKRAKDGGFTVGSPATDKEGTDDLSQAESESSHASVKVDSWASSDEDDLDFSPKKTTKPSLTQLMHTKKNSKGKSEKQGRKKSNSEGMIDCTKKQDEDQNIKNGDEESDNEEIQNDDEECEDEEIQDDNEEMQNDNEECEDDDEEGEEDEEESNDYEEEEEEEGCEEQDDNEEEKEDGDDGECISESHEDRSEKKVDKSVGENGKTCLTDAGNEAVHVTEGVECTSELGNDIGTDNMENMQQSCCDNTLPTFCPKSVQDIKDAQVCLDTNEVPVSLIFGLLEHDDENGGSPIESEVTMLKSSLKSMQTDEQDSFANTVEECSKKKSKRKQPCIAVDSLRNSDDVCDKTHNNISHFSCEAVEQVDSINGVANTAGVEGIHTRVFEKHDESFSGDEVDESAKQSLKTDTAQPEMVQTSGDGVGRKVALMTELGFEDDDVESPWDSESASESPRKQSASDVVPSSVQTHMQCISEESNEDMYYCPSFPKQSRSCKIQDEGWHFRQRGMIHFV